MRIHERIDSILMSVLLACLACAGTPVAAQSTAAAATGGGKPAQKLLTRDQLRACMSQEQRIRAASAETVTFQSSLEALKTEIGTLDAALKEKAAGFAAKKAAVDPADTEAVAALQGESEVLTGEAGTLDAKIADYNTRLPEFNKKVDALNADKLAYKSACADRAYDEKDYFAIKRGK